MIITERQANDIPVIDYARVKYISIGFKVTDEEEEEEENTEF